VIEALGILDSGETGGGGVNYYVITVFTIGCFSEGNGGEVEACECGFGCGCCASGVGKLTRYRCSIEGCIKVLFGGGDSEWDQRDFGVREVLLARDSKFCVAG
jgi:hypothetical protein